ncbi:MAG: hypothetical protein QOJ76_2071 [Acidobacteriota bacterium]|jgi:hypothetical protein|nr:hypothetical protein [Acidobacteriota bacterium]
MVMNKIENARCKTFASVLFPLFALLVVLAQPQQASAQWSAPDAQGNISNTNTGNVGIGTTTPENSEGWNKVLDVFGNQHAKFSLRTPNIDARVMSHDIGWWGAPAGMVIGTRTGHPISFATSGASRMTIGNTGNVGIGTMSPGFTLDVVGGLSRISGIKLGGYGTTTTDTVISSASAAGYLGFVKDDGAALPVKVGSLAITDSYVNSAPAFGMYVQGNVGVGTANPAYKLDVTGPIRSAAGGFVFPDGTTQTTAASGASAAANISAGQFGQNAGGGNFSFPSNVVANTSVAAFIDSGANNRFRVCGPNAACSIAGEYIGGRIRLSGDGSFANAEALLDPGMGGINAPGNAYVGGNVGIGTTAPATKLHVVGDVTVTGNISAKYQDVAEWVPSTQKLSAGMVVVLDPELPNHVLASTASYDTSVAGVISERPGLALGEAGEGKALVATTGRVKVRVDATHAPIRIGDLLVTSDVAGVAMKSEPVAVGGRRMHAPGTIIGKALESLAGGTGEILVLLSLQ